MGYEAKPIEKNEKGLTAQTTHHLSGDESRENRVLKEENRKKAASIKLLGEDADFLDDILSTLRNSYAVVVTSRVIFNQATREYHLFCSVIPRGNHA